MTIERTDGDIILKVSGDMDILSLQKLINFLKYKETIKDSKATDEDVQKLSNEIKSNWWKENKKRFIK